MMTLQEAVAQLPSTTEELVRLLPPDDVAQGMNRSTNCPVARLLTDLVGEPVRVGYTSAHIASHLQHIEFISLPTHVTNLIYKMDSARDRAEAAS